MALELTTDQARLIARLRRRWPGADVRATSARGASSSRCVATGAPSRSPLWMARAASRPRAPSPTPP